MIYFTSDLHLNHEKIIKLCNRPFADVEVMNETIISNWNKTVKNDDTIYILGDFQMSKKGDVANEFLKKLNGKKILIVGNHDHFLKSSNFDKNLFTDIKIYEEIRYKDRMFCLFHYPIYEWNGFYRDAICLHGHVHTDNKDKKQLTKSLGNIYDVGVDGNNFVPVSIEKILEMFPVANQKK